MCVTHCIRIDNLPIWYSKLRPYLHHRAANDGPLASGGTGTFNPNNMSVVDNWNTIMNVNTDTIGVDDEGLEVFDEPRVFVIGGEDNALPKRPLTVTYEPVGCGRVLFSTYHTTHETHVGLVRQERILLYLIMEIGVCKEGPILI